MARVMRREEITALENFMVKRKLEMFKRGTCAPKALC